eukprot:gene5536-14180_t
MFPASSHDGIKAVHRLVGYAALATGIANAALGVASPG